MHTEEVISSPTTSAGENGIFMWNDLLDSSYYLIKNSTPDRPKSYHEMWNPQTSRQKSTENISRPKQGLYE